MGIVGRDLANHFNQHAERAADVLRVYNRLSARVAEVRERCEAELDAALADLAEAYLPELTPAALADLASRAGYKKFTRRDPIKALQHEIAVLRRRIAVIAADERYQRREWLVGPNGERTRALAEARSMLEPWEEACQRFEGQAHFTTLIDLGYDTPDYKVGWLEPRYWTFWAAGDRICAELGLDDFGDDVLPAWREVEEPRRKWREQVALAEASVNEVHDLVREHDQAHLRIQNLPAEYLATCRKAIAEFLKLADLPLLAQWNDNHAAPSREVTMGLRRAAGIDAKLKALDELKQKGVRPMVRSLDERYAKYKRKVGKFLRSKHASNTFPDHFADRKFAQKSKKYEARAVEAMALVDRIGRYDTFERFDVAQNPPEMWFREMTGKRPSRMFPGLRGFYDREPGLKPVLEKRAKDRAARAVASRVAADDLGYLS